MSFRKVFLGTPLSLVCVTAFSTGRSLTERPISSLASKLPASTWRRSRTSWDHPLLKSCCVVTCYHTVRTLHYEIMTGWHSCSNERKSYGTKCVSLLDFVTE